MVQVKVKTSINIACATKYVEVLKHIEGLTNVVYVVIYSLFILCFMVCLLLSLI
jgi:hypothetical protein